MKRYIFLISLILINTIDPPPESCNPNERLIPDSRCQTICNENEYFNYITSVCDKCEEDEVYDEIERKCKPKCESDEIYNFENKKCEIQPDCLNDEIFNPEIKKCEKIEKNNCKENEDYDKIDKKCFINKEKKIIINNGEHNLNDRGESDNNDYNDIPQDDNNNNSPEIEYINFSCSNGYRWEDKKKICLPYKKCEEEKQLDEELGYIPAPSKVWDPYKKNV